MNVNSKELVGANVETRSGEHVGKLASLDFDANTGHLASVRVLLPGIISGLLSDEAIVDWSNVIEVMPNKVVISDGAVPARARAVASAEPAAPAAMLKEG